MFKLALSAGHYINTPGKRCLKSLDPKETREWWLNDRIADRIEVLLSEYENVQVLRLDDTTGKTEVELSTRANKSNTFGANLYLAIHHNAGINGGSGGGIVSYAYNGTVSSTTLDYHKKFYDELIKLTGLKGNRGNPIARANLYECRVPNAPAVLLELGFMDSKTDVPIILTQDFAYKCAQACVNVIVTREGLKKKNKTPIVASTYKLVTDVNKYSSSDDAKNKTNSKGILKAGAYYIYSKYPNGVNGMYNLTTDKTGAAAGAWVNPNENVAINPAYYYIRKSWDDPSSQKGVYASITAAKTKCDQVGYGYHIFTGTGKLMYSAPAPVSSTNIYDLKFPTTHLIVDMDIIQTEGINEEICTKAIVAIKKNNPNFNIEIAKAFFTFSDEYHIDPIRAISQSILETGWFKFEGSSVNASQNNFCGLGTTGGGVAGASFKTIEEGVRAQLQHLYAYGCKDALPDGETTIVDPRFNLVTRGIAPNWEQLAGRWAVPGFDGSDPAAAIKAGTTYGQKIDKIFDIIVNTAITENDVKTCFPVDEESVTEPEEKVEIQQPTVDSNQKFVFDFLAKLIKNLIDFFKNLGGNE